MIIPRSTCFGLDTGGDKFGTGVTNWLLNWFREISRRGFWSEHRWLQGQNESKTFGESWTLHFFIGETGGDVDET